MALKKNRIDRTNAAWDRALELQSDIDHLNGKLVDAESKKEEIEIQLQRLRDQQEFEEEVRCTNYVGALLLKFCRN